MSSSTRLTKSDFASPSGWCGGKRGLGSAFGDVLRSPEAFDAQLSSNFLPPAATLQMVALLRHPDGVDQLARGEIDQISIGAVAECGVVRPVCVPRMRLTAPHTRQHLALPPAPKAHA